MAASMQLGGIDVGVDRLMVRGVKEDDGTEFFCVRDQSGMLLSTTDRAELRRLRDSLSTLLKFFAEGDL